MNDKIYVVKREIVRDGSDPSFEVDVHKSLQGAMDQYHNIVNDILRNWTDTCEEGTFATDIGETSFSIYLNGFYQTDHESVNVEEQELLD